MDGSPGPASGGSRVQSSLHRRIDDPVRHPFDVVHERHHDRIVLRGGPLRVHAVAEAVDDRVLEIPVVSEGAEVAAEPRLRIRLVLARRLVDRRAEGHLAAGEVAARAGRDRRDVGLAGVGIDRVPVGPERLARVVHVEVAEEHVRGRGVDVAALEPRAHGVAVGLHEVVALEAEVIRSCDAHGDREGAQEGEVHPALHGDLLPEREFGWRGRHHGVPREQRREEPSKPRAKPPGALTRAPGSDAIQVLAPIQDPDRAAPDSCDLVRREGLPA